MSWYVANWQLCPWLSANITESKAIIPLFIETLGQVKGFQLRQEDIICTNQQFSEIERYQPMPTFLVYGKKLTNEYVTEKCCSQATLTQRDCSNGFAI